MLTSKTILSHLLTILVGMSLAGCTLPEPKSKDDVGSMAQNKSSTFTLVVMPEKSKAMDGSVFGTFALPQNKVVTFSVCARDIAYNNIIVGHNFKIEETKQTITSDKAGCINWSENFNYNILGLSRYLRIDRTITGLGIQKGSQAISFAINPWSHGETLAPVLNPKDGTGIPEYIEQPEAVKQALNGYIGGKLTERKLWIEDGRLFVTEQQLNQDGITLGVEMRPNISIQMSKMNGEHFLRPVTAGQFKARFKLIHVYFDQDKEIRRELSQTAPFDIKIEHGSMALRSPIHIPARPTRGQMYLGVELLPVGGPVGLVRFEGIFLMGEYDALKGMSLVKLHTSVVQEENFELKTFINSNINDIQSTTGKDGIDESAPYQKPKIEVSQLDFRFIRIGKETTSTREVIYNVRACVRHGLDQKSTTSHLFKVTKFKENSNSPVKEVEIRTDNNSCLNWDESIVHNYFDCHRNIKGTIRIQNATMGMDQNLEILVNPWETFGTIARDLRYVDSSNDLVLACSATNRPKTQIHMETYSYSTLSYDYSVDRFLNLTMSKKIQLKTNPKMLVYSSLSSGRAETTSLRDGIYVLRAAIVQNADYDTTNTYVASADRIVNVLGGEINTDLTFSTQDLKSLGNRNNILFEIYPANEEKLTFNGNAISPKSGLSITDVIDTTSSLETQTFIGPITLNLDEISRPVRIADPRALNEYFVAGKKPVLKNGQIIAEILKSGAQLQRNKLARIGHKAQKSQFAKENNFTIVDLNTVRDENPLANKLTQGTNLADHLHISKQELTNWLKKGEFSPELAQKLCTFWAMDFFRSQYEAKGGVIPKQTRFTFGHQCYQSVLSDPSKFFITDKRDLISDVEGSKLMKGLNQGLTVGASFSVAANHNYSKTRSMSIGSKIGFSPKIVPFLSTGVDVGYSMSWATSDATSNGNSISVSSNTSMTVQQNTFKIKVKSYEQCVTISLNPRLFVRNENKRFYQSNTDFLDYLNPSLTEDEKIDSVSRGLMVCDGTLTTKEKEITENYFLIAQETGSTQMQDSGDERNRQFFIALRSTHDFNRFLIATKAQLKTPQSQAQDGATQEVMSFVESLFKAGSPSYPGMYITP